MTSAKMNDNSESIWQTALEPVLTIKYDWATFVEVVIVVYCFDKLSFTEEDFLDSVLSKLILVHSFTE